MRDSWFYADASDEGGAVGGRQAMGRDATLVFTMAVVIPGASHRGADWKAPVRANFE